MDDVNTNLSVGTVVQTLDSDALKYKYRNKKGEILRKAVGYNDYLIVFPNGEEVGFQRSDFYIFGDEADKQFRIQQSTIVDTLIKVADLRSALDDIYTNLESLQVEKG